MSHHLILRVVAKLLIPFILLYALYVQFHGDFGPGGGFQAGVIFASAFVLYALIYGVEKTRQVMPDKVVQDKFFTPELAPIFKDLVTRLEQVDLTDKAQVEEVFKLVLESHQIKFKQIAQPVRVALTGKTVSPGIFEIIATLDTVVVDRLKAALACMEARQ